MEFRIPRQKVVVRTSGDVLSLNYLLIYLMAVSSDFLRKLRYSFQYLTQYSFMVSRVVQYFLVSLKLSQLFKLNQLFLSSDRFLINFCRCLKRIRVILFLLFGLTSRWARFRVRQQMNLQQWSWLIRMWLFLVQVLPSSCCLSMMRDLLERRLMFDALFSISYPIELFWLRYRLAFFGGFFSSTSGLSSFLNFKAKNYYLVSRFSASSEHNLSKSYRLVVEILNLSERQQGRLFIFLMSSFSFLHSQGVMPVINSQKMTPNEKMSLEGEQTFFTSASSGMYRGVPTLYLVFIYPSLYMAKPKSAIFQFLRLLSMLAGFKSRCSMLFFSRYLTPSKISLMTSTATVY